MELSNYQLFVVNNKVKFFLVRSCPLFSSEVWVQSHFHNSYVHPRYRLWNWKASDVDTVYVIGNLIRYYSISIQQVFNLFAQRPQLKSIGISFSMLMEFVEEQMMDGECTFDKTCFASSLYSIAEEMMYSSFLFLNRSPVHSLSLDESIRLFNIMLTPEDQIKTKAYSIQATPSISIQQNQIPFLLHPTKLEIDKEKEWNALQVFVLYIPY